MEVDRCRMGPSGVWTQSRCLVGVSTCAAIYPGGLLVRLLGWFAVTGRFEDPWEVTELLTGETEDRKVAETWAMHSYEQPRVPETLGSVWQDHEANL